MSKEEFIEKYRAQQKHGTGWAILYVVLLLSFLASGAIFSKHLEAQSKLFQRICDIVFFIVIFGQLPVLYWYIRYETRKFGLHCPSCDKPLAGVSAQIAIAAGHCGHCGVKLFSDSPAALNPDDNKA